MAWGGKFLQNNFFIKLRSWEYWPFGIVQFPIFFYYPWLALRAGSLTFFSASNPGILMGGMFGESKFDVLQLIPAHLIPKTIRVRQPCTMVLLLDLIEKNKFRFPLIFKPDIGERGFMVRRINNGDDVVLYLKDMNHDFLIQELVDAPLEFGVFYSRLPSVEKGKVTSVVRKEMLTVEGDGVSTLEQLIANNERARLQWPILRKRYFYELNSILPPGRKREIVSIGNHCLGTKFINANHLITEGLSETFDGISKNIPGFFFGRFDLRCESIADLQIGKVKILELNGCGAEPAHIYDPGFSFWEAVGVLIRHWKTIFVIANENARRGINYLPLTEAVKHFRNFKNKTSNSTSGT
jgi:hypothetical protein